jgi:transposase
VMQFAEGLSDRQAAEAVRARIDWKDVLGLELTDPAFDFSVLCEFRARLVAGSAEHRLLDALLEACKQRGCLKARGRQRTDATQVVGALRILNRLERVAETLRMALNVLAREAPEWLLPQGQEARHAYLAQVGEDGHWLLAALQADEQAETVRDLPEVALLRQIWEQQFERGADGQMRLRDPKVMPAASEIIESPDEPEARFATKRGLHWTGYKVHLTETCDAASPHLISSRRLPPPLLQQLTRTNSRPSRTRWPRAICSLPNRWSMPVTCGPAIWSPAASGMALMSLAPSILTMRGRPKALTAST